MQPAVLALVLTFAVPLLPVAQAQKAVPPAAAADASKAFFSRGEIPELEVEIAADEVQKLKAAPRSYAHGSVRERKGGQWADVGIKLKGSAGSYREFDDKPALTLRVTRFATQPLFHGLDKFHLNNSVQDDTYLSELLGADLFTAAGLAAARVTHARVWLNGRDVGLYVLKEGFDQRFLARHFTATGGTLYDGGFCQDIDAALQQDVGHDSTHSDLAALLAACQEPEPRLRRERLPQVLDVEAFLTFTALELMLGHWDGYAQNHNNYRLYFAPTTNRATFLPHGMDQLFGDPEASILAPTAAIAARAVLRLPEYRTRFRKRIVELLSLFAAPRLEQRIAEAAARLRPVLQAMDPAAASVHAEAVRGLRERVATRCRDLRSQSTAPDPQPLQLLRGRPQELRGWHPASETEDAQLAATRLEVGKVLAIASGKSGVCTASWRTTVLLAPGRYRLQASAMTADVRPAAGGGDRAGVAVRISGAEPSAPLRGNARWQKLEFEFAVAHEPDEIELVAELRAASGRVWFRLEAMTLTRLGD